MKIRISLLGISIALFFNSFGTCTLVTPGQTFATGSNPEAVSFAFPGTCLAVVNTGDSIAEVAGDISMFSLDPLTSSITKVNGPNASGNYTTATSQPVALAFSPLGKVLAVANNGPLFVGGITLFKVNQTNCTLTQIQGPGTNGIFPINGNPAAIAFSPNGQFIVTVNTTNTFSTISVFKIDCSTLALTQVGTDIITNFNSLTAIAFSPNCTCLAIIDEGSCSPMGSSTLNGQVIMYTFNSQTGGLSQVNAYSTNIPFSTNIAFSTTGTCLAVATTGVLIPACGVLPTPGGIGMFSVNADCTLNSITGPNSNGTFGDEHPVAVAFSADGNCLAESNTGSTTSFASLFSFSAKKCTLALVQSPINAGSSIGGLAYSQDLRNLAIANPSAGSVTVLSTDITLNALSRFIRNTLCLPPCNPCI